MRNQSSNSFNDGINLDISPYQIPNTAMSDCVNCELLTQEGNEFILQNDKGNTYRTGIKENYIPVASGVYRGVAYIYSAEVINNQFTGVGELGSFPSPDYNNLTLKPGSTQILTGSLTYDYRPLKNYLNESLDPFSPAVLFEPLTTYGTAGSVYGDFNTSLFNCTQNTNYEMQIQPSYDESVNIIITDNVNPPLLINNRFTPRKSDKVDIIDRTGLKDVNLYHKDLFKTTMKLVQSSSKLLNVDLEDINETGALKGGTYRYYFAYESQDGNYTDVVGETFQIPIFKGTKMLDINGVNQDQNTNKAVVISLKNLDTSFSKLRVYYTRHYGEFSEISQTYLLDINLVVNNTSITFTHTGRENEFPIDSSILSLTFSTIDTVRTIAQTQSRLFLGGISLKGYNVDALSEFASNIKIRQTQDQLGVRPGNFSGSNPYGISVIEKNLGFGSTVRPHGYYNPFNVYYNSSYFGGETYMLGIVFFLKDGGSTPVFPLKGIDNWNGGGDLNYTLNPQTLDETNNYFSNVTGENLRGIYRFKDRTDPLVTEGVVNVFGLDLELPISNINPEGYPEGTVGFMFVRAPRIPDLLVQGYLINTCAIPVVDTTPQEYEGNQYFDYDFTEDSIKYIPAINFIIEGSAIKDADGTEGQNSGNKRLNDGVNGIFPFQLTNRYWSQQLSTTYNKKFALITPDLMKESAVSSIGGTGFDLHLKGTVTCDLKIPTNSWWSEEALGFKHFSLFETKSHSTFSTSVVPDASINYVLGSNDATSPERFTTGASFTFRRNNSKNRSFGFVENFYNPYLGVSLTNNLPTSLHTYPAPTDLRYGSDLRPNTVDGFYIDKTTDALLNVNLYKELGYTRGTNTSDLNRLFNTHNYVNQQFSPISKRIYWNNSLRPDNQGASLEEIGGDGVFGTSLKVWGGDCYPTAVYRRMFYNKQTRLPTGDDPDQTNTGYTLETVCESSLLPTMRSTYIFNVTEENVVRSFIPELLDTLNTPLGDRFERLHQWRRYRAPETNVINEGGKWLAEERILSPVDIAAPFLKQRFPTRVMYSDANTYDSFVNGYRNIFPIARQDYNQDYGDIIALREVNNILLCVQERAISILDVNNREAITDSSSGAVFLQGAGVLSSFAQVLTSSYGSTLQDSVTKSESAVYGVDDQGKVWRVGGQGVQFISDNAIQSALKQFVPLIASREIDQLFNNIRTHYDQHKKSIYITSYTYAESNATSEGVVIIPDGEEENYFQVGWLVSYSTLREYLNGSLTGLTKPNTIGDSNYVVPELKLVSESPCPFEDPVEAVSCTPLYSGISEAFLSEANPYVTEVSLAQGINQGDFVVAGTYTISYVVSAPTTLVTSVAGVVLDTRIVDNTGFFLITSLLGISRVILSPVVPSLGVGAFNFVIFPPCFNNTPTDNFTGWRVQLSSGTCEPFYKKRAVRENLYTFVYSELTQKWITRYSYYPIHSFNIRDKHYTFNLLKDSYQIWEHHSNTIRCNYYGDQFEFEIEFCINQDPLTQKIFTNFIIASNEVPPKYIMYDTDNELELDDVRPIFISNKPMVQQDVKPRFRGRYRQGDIRSSYLSHNCDWKENHHYIQIDKNTNDTRDNDPELKPTLFNNNRDIRDKFVRVRFRYEGSEYSIIQAIITKFIMSFS